jgi:transcriptional regulator with XRE-family HTH domain
MAKAKDPVGPNRHTLSDQLRAIIAGRGMTPTELGQLAGVDPTVIARFITGEREIRSGTLDKIAAALSVRLVEVAPPRARGRSTGPGKG